MKKQFLASLFLLATTVVSAQLFEIGVFAAEATISETLVLQNIINPNFPAAGGVAKYNWTPRINFRGTLIWTDLTANDSKADTDFRINRGLSFKNRILEASAGIEFNFFKYNLAKVGFSQTPYIVVQAGLVNYRIVSEQVSPTTVGTKRITSMVFPVGVGYKMRLAQNFGIAFETTFRYTFKDVIDFNNHSIDDPAFNSRL